MAEQTEVSTSPAIDEGWLQQQIEGIWGAFGAHALIYNELLRRVRVGSRTYYDGCRDALRWYAFMKDGVSYVGSCGRTLKEALADVDKAEVEGKPYGMGSASGRAGALHMNPGNERGFGAGEKPAQERLLPGRGPSELKDEENDPQ